MYKATPEEGTEWVAPPRLSGNPDNSPQRSDFKQSYDGNRSDDELSKILREEAEQSLAAEMRSPLEEDSIEEYGEDEEEEDYEEDLYAYYDSVEVPTEQGRVYVAFNKFHTYAQYLVTFNYGTESYELDEGK